MSAPSSHLTDPFFWFCVGECINNDELLIEYDRLRGTNLCGKGSALERLFDKQTGRIEAEFRDFVEFVREGIYERARPKEI